MVLVHYNGFRICCIQVLGRSLYEQHIHRPIVNRKLSNIYVNYRTA